MQCVVHAFSLRGFLKTGSKTAATIFWFPSWRGQWSTRPQEHAILNGRGFPRAEQHYCGQTGDMCRTTDKTARLRLKLSQLHKNFKANFNYFCFLNQSFSSHGVSAVVATEYRLYTVSKCCLTNHLALLCGSLKSRNRRFHAGIHCYLWSPAQLLVFGLTSRSDSCTLKAVKRHSLPHFKGSRSL